MKPSCQFLCLVTDFPEAVIFQPLIDREMSKRRIEKSESEKMNITRYFQIENQQYLSKSVNEKEVILRPREKENKKITKFLTIEKPVKDVSVPVPVVEKKPIIRRKKKVDGKIEDFFKKAPKEKK